MPERKKLLESSMKVRFHDCDPFGHLNNSRYIDYIITARGDQLIENYSFDIYELARKEGIGWVSAQTQISYLYPAYLMEEIIIQTQLIGFTSKSLLLEAFVWDIKKSRLKTIMWTKLVHFNLASQKSHEHSPALMNFFESIVNEQPNVTDFEARVSASKSLNSR